MERATSALAQRYLSYSREILTWRRQQPQKQLNIVRYEDLILRSEEALHQLARHNWTRPPF